MGVVSRVEQLENEIQKLSLAELRQVRDWLHEFADARLSFNKGIKPANIPSEAEAHPKVPGLQRLLSRPAFNLTPDQFNTSMEVGVWDK
ncbi:MAG TPA: hypothetical protein VGO67_20510 [Verrucomicrobiae bacterium]|jgi:hypothetical protein